MKRGVISNPRKAGPTLNTNLPNGAYAIAESRNEHDLLVASVLGNRATRRLARRNLRKVRRP